MGFNIISAAEAASYVKHGYNIGLSGFTPAGTPKAVTPEIAKIAEEEHAKGNPFQIGIFTGASTGDATDGILSRVKAIRYRAPYTTNPDFRKAVNNGEIAYNDIHLSGHHLSDPRCRSDPHKSDTSRHPSPSPAYQSQESGRNCNAHPAVLPHHENRNSR